SAVAQDASTRGPLEVIAPTPVYRESFSLPTSRPFNGRARVGMGYILIAFTHSLSRFLNITSVIRIPESGIRGLMPKPWRAPLPLWALWERVGERGHY